MPNITIRDLKPKSTSSTTLDIPNTTSAPAQAAIEIINLTESRSNLTSYLMVDIIELRDEPRTMLQGIKLDELARQGFTRLSDIPTGKVQTYEFRVVVANDIPDEFQKQKVTFDLKIGTEKERVSQPSISATPSHASQAQGSVLGIATAQPTSTSTKLTPSKPISLHPLMYFFIALSLLCLCIYLVVQWFRRVMHRHPK